MAERLIRKLLFSKTPLKGYYRFGDIFQLAPAPESAPRPPDPMADHPLILEFRYDTRIACDREEDFWHRDVWERKRDQELGEDGWTEDQLSMHRSHTESSRQWAIVKELTVILSALTNHRFFEYESKGAWIDSRIHNPGAPETETTISTIWAYTGYRLPELDWPEEEFLCPISEAVPRVPYGEHYKDLPDAYVVGQEFEIHIPDALDDFLEIYFALEADTKQAFYAACHLWGQAFDLRSNTPSMSLVASVSAIETLVNYMDVPGSPCQECGISRSLERCPACSTPRYRLTSRFREFLKKYAGSDAKFANRLYGYRSSISHAGALLRAELFDSGFTKGGDDEQIIFRHATTRVTHIALVNWLITRASTMAEK